MEQYKEQVKTKGLVVAYFTANDNTCDACKNVDPLLRKVLDETKDDAFKLLMVDFYDDKDVVMHEKVTSIPHFIFYSVGINILFTCYIQL